MPEEFAQHWQITLDFLLILSEHWPKILEENGVIDPAQRRDRLIRALAEFWRDHPPDIPIIAAGSTGSIPSVADLFDVITALPEGAVILPGLDHNMDVQSWDAVDETHAQFGLKHLLDHLNVAREDVSLWPCDIDERTGKRGKLVSEILRPAEASAAWQTLSSNKHAQESFRSALENINFHECETMRAEADLIAVYLRGLLEEPDKTAAIITPDRNLARRIAATLERWNIHIDDSAGTRASESSTGIFLTLLGHCAAQNMAPVSLLAFLKHPLCDLEGGKKPCPLFETILLRGLKPKPGLSGLHDRLQDYKESRHYTPETYDALSNFLKSLEDKFSKIASYQDGVFSFPDLLRALIETAEIFCPRAHLWKGESGEAISHLLSGLQDHAGIIPDVTLGQCVQIISDLMKAQTVRPAYGTHPRLAILGQLEARLIEADMIILAGLNEGTWPPDPGHDPWMSRPMRAEFGLPAPERQIGLSAHDFAQGFCADAHVILTRSKRVDGSPTVPARWLERLQTVLKACKIPKGVLDSPHIEAYQRALDYSGEISPCARPAPTPALSARPKQLSVTRIETWLKDPYSIYAEKILGLQKLDPLEKEIGAAERGNLMHKILEEFAKAYPDALPADIPAALREIAHRELENLHDDPALWSFWWPRFEKIASWISVQEKNWRENVKNIRTEIRGTLKLRTHDFTLTGTADRIDEFHDGSFGIIDYKTGGSLSQKGIKTGRLPQLALEAAILLKGGFADMNAYEISYLGYWQLSGGAKAGKEHALAEPLNALAEASLTNLEELVESFMDETVPYYALPRPDFTPAFQDYEHLARVKEWAALDDKTQESA